MAKARIRLILIAVAPILLALALDGLFPLPLPALTDDLSTVVVDRADRPLRAFPAPSGVWRFAVTQEAVAPDYFRALFAFEDRLSVTVSGADRFMEGGREELARTTDAYLRLFAEAGLIGAGLRDAALARPLAFRDLVADPAWVPATPGKGTTAVRARLADLARAEGELAATLGQRPSIHG